MKIQKVLVFGLVSILVLSGFSFIVASKDDSISGDTKIISEVKKVNETDYKNNEMGVYLSGTSENNLFYHNDLLSNTGQAYDYGTGNEWYNGSLEEVNYWTDYEGTDSDGDGIGDTPYNINGQSQSKDEYPLIDPWREDKTAPVADAGDNKTVGVGEEFTLDGSGSTDDVSIVSYEWNLGDGVTETGEKITYSYDEVGEYDVTLTVTDQAGNTDSDTVRIEVVKGELVVDDIEVPDSAVVGKEVTITAQVENIGGTDLEDHIYIDGEPVKSFILQAGGSKDVILDYVFDSTGTYTVSVGDVESTVTITSMVVIENTSIDRQTITKGDMVTITAHITNNDDSMNEVDITIEGVKSIHGKLVLKRAVSHSYTSIPSMRAEHLM